MTRSSFILILKTWHYWIKTYQNKVFSQAKLITNMLTQTSHEMTLTQSLSQAAMGTSAYVLCCLQAVMSGSGLIYSWNPPPPHLLRWGIGPPKNWVTWGVPKFLLERITLRKGQGGWCKNRGGGHFFLLLYSYIYILSVCMCVCLCLRVCMCVCVCVICIFLIHSW